MATLIIMVGCFLVLVGNAWEKPWGLALAALGAGLLAWRLGYGV